MRNGAESAVYINTAQEFDGSDAGARPDEAVSWGKIKVGGDSVKVYAEATIVFPLIVAATFAKAGQKKEEGGKEEDWKQVKGEGVPAHQRSASSSTGTSLPSETLATWRDEAGKGD